MKPILGSLILLAAISSIAPGADKPNLSGTWKANFEKSDYGVLPRPNSFTRTIVHTEPAISFEDLQETDIGPNSSTRKYSTDGKETSFESQGAEVKGSAIWDSGKLLVKSNVEAASMQITETISPAADGKSLTSVVHIKTPQGDLDVKVVFVKQ